MTTPRPVEAIALDVRYGLRQLRRSPAFAVVVVLSLGLGIGANSALFSVVNAVVLRAASVLEPATLVGLGWVQGKTFPRDLIENQSGRHTDDPMERSVGLSFPHPSYEYMRTHARTLSDLAGFAPFGMFTRASAVVRGEPMFVDGDMVTGGYFRTLGVGAALGRVIVDGDEAPGAPRAGVISDGFWARVFGRDRAALGTTITVSGVPVTIVGVAPRWFTGLDAGRPRDLWIPITVQGSLTPWGVRPKSASDLAFAEPTYWWLQLVGRLGPGVPEEDARSECSHLLGASFAGTVPDAALSEVPRVALLPAARAFNTVTQRLTKPLAVLGAVVTMVLLLCCTNVATLLLVRATSRRREMSLRLAMGATRVRLFRQLLTEYALYALAAGAIGLAFARAVGRLLLLLLSTNHRFPPVEVTVDLRVFAFTAFVSVLTALLFGLAPALCATRVRAAADFKDGVGGSARELRLGRLRLGRSLVAAQIAMTLPLVIGAGLFLRTLANLEREPLGFTSENLLLFSLDPTKAGYADEAGPGRFETVRQAVAAVPGVETATFSCLPLVSGWTNNSRVAIEGQPADPDPRKRIAHWNAVGPAFAETLGMRLVLGRALDERDDRHSPKVAVVNETMAGTFFGGANPIGRRFRRGAEGERDEAMTVVGVVADAKYASLRSPAPPTYFVPYGQAKMPPSLSTVFFEVRTTGDPRAIVGRVRQSVGAIAPGVPLGNVTTQKAQIAESLGQERMFAALLTCFGLLALAIACLGVQGAMAYTLRRRTREIGIRMALGAGRVSVLRMALVETLVIAMAGLASGGALAVGGTRLIGSLLFGVTPLDPATVACGSLLLMGVAVMAGYVPARRASRLDPMQALREE